MAQARNLDTETDAPHALAAQFRAVRGASLKLATPLSAEDCGAQSMEDASPVKWHLAHTSWFFETFVLAPTVAGYRAFRPHFEVLFNSYYNSVGDQYARPQRGLLTRPLLDEVMAYRSHVDRHMLSLLAKGPDLEASVAQIVALGLHHEQQHQELILTDLKHLLAQNPLRPVYAEAAAAAAGPDAAAPPLAWHAFEEGLFEIGHAGGGFCFDNETPRHRAFLEAFALASRPATNAEYREFIRDGGYQNPDHWLSDGWSALQARGWRAPLYWNENDGGASETFTLGGLLPLRDDEPVTHVSYYEADAYARWTGARLPSEQEWERAACEVPIGGNFVESERLHPAPSGPRNDDRASALFGDVWEWTRSPYAPYPGFRAAAGALGEYNGKFMCNQMVLRGGSCATPHSHIRASYRNFFFPDARWQFSGIRLARDI